jgi:hypothetical protein
MDRTMASEIQRHPAICPGLIGARQRPPRRKRRQFTASAPVRSTPPEPVPAGEPRSGLEGPPDLAGIPDWAPVPRDPGDTEPS